MSNKNARKINFFRLFSLFLRKKRRNTALLLNFPTQNVRKTTRSLKKVTSARHRGFSYKHFLYCAIISNTMKTITRANQIQQRYGKASCLWRRGVRLASLNPEKSVNCPLHRRRGIELTGPWLGKRGQKDAADSEEKEIFRRAPHLFTKARRSPPKDWAHLSLRILRRKNATMPPCPMPCCNPAVPHAGAVCLSLLYTGD